MKLLVMVAALMILFNPASAKSRFSDTSNIWSGMLVTYDPEIREHPAGAIYQRDTLIHDTLYQVIRGVEQLGIREDTAAKKIFCRFLAPRYAFNPTDSLEHVLFDYNMRVGDSFVVSYGPFRTVHRVQTITSVQFNGVTHRVWFMQPVRTGGTHPLARHYSFIEGIGPTALPTFSMCAVVFEHHYQLLCFRTQRTRAHCVPAIGMFDNDQSCSYRVGVAAEHIPGAILVSPNPGGVEMKLNVAGIPAARLFVHDAIGRVVINNLQVEDGEAVPIGRLLQVPGTYFYRILLTPSNESLAGSFVYR